MEKHVRGLKEFEAEATAFALGLRPKEGGAMLVTLSGELGAGKTTFVQSVARSFGITEGITSPTFILLKSYQLPKGSAFVRLAHIDAYRLQRGEELAPLDFSRLMDDSSALVMLEWPEKVAEALPTADVMISLRVLSGSDRTISYA